MPTSTVEDYLKSILLEQRDDPQKLVSMGRIAAALDLAPGTVTSMVKTLAASGLVLYEPYSGVRLTPSGRGLALHVLRRHRLVELFLVRVLGMDWSEVHPEAERLEHVLSDRLMERIDEMLGEPSVDPHGDPIPTVHGELPLIEHSSLLGCSAGSRVRVARVTDQSPEFLRLLESQGLVPGSLVTVEDRNEMADTLTLRGSAGGRGFSLGFRAASKILVEPGGAADEAGGKQAPVLPSRG